MRHSLALVAFGLAALVGGAVAEFTPTAQSEISGSVIYSHNGADFQWVITPGVTVEDDGTAAELFTLADLTCVGGTMSNFYDSSGVRTEYTVTVSPEDDTTDVTMTILAGSFEQDNTASATAVVTEVIEFAPTATLTQTSTPNDDIHKGTVVVNFQVVFSEPVSDFVIGDITCTAGTVGSFVASTSVLYTFDVTPTGGNYDVYISADVATGDTSSMGNRVSTSITVYSAPVLVATYKAAASPQGWHNGDTAVAGTITLTFSPSVDDATVDSDTTDFAIVGASWAAATLTTVTSGQVYTLSVKPDVAEAAITVEVTGSITSDVENEPLVGYGATAVAVYKQSCVISDATSHDGQTKVEGITATFSDDTTVGVAEGEFVVTGGTLSDFSNDGSGVYSFSLTPSSSADMTVYYPADLASPLNTVSNTETVHFGVPRVTITALDGNTGTHDGASAVRMQIAFTHAVTGWATDGTDLYVAGGSFVAGSMVEGTGADASRVWIASIIPSSTNNMAVYMPGGRADSTIDSNNTNTPSNTLTFQYREQWGTVSVYSLNSKTANGGTTPKSIVQTGTTGTITMEGWRYAEGIDLCLQRNKDMTVSASKLTGDFLIKVTLQNGDPSHKVATKVITSNENVGNCASNACRTYGGDDVKADDYFWMYFADDTDNPETMDGEIVCVNTWFTRTASDWISWGADGVGESNAGGAMDLCAVEESFLIEFEAHKVGVSAANCDSPVVSGTPMTAGAQDAGCEDNSRFFNDGLETLSVVRARTTVPPLTIMDVAAVDALFSSSDPPPAPNTPGYTQDSPHRLVVLERTCTEDLNAANVAQENTAQWKQDTVVTIADLVKQYNGMPSIEDGGEFEVFSVSSPGGAAYSTWFDGLTLDTPISTVTFTGAECGSVYRQFLMIKMSAGTAIGVSGDPNIPDYIRQGVLNYTNAITLSGGATGSCANSAFVDPNPEVILTMRDDVARTNNLAETGIAIAPVDTRIFVSDLAISGSNLVSYVGVVMHGSDEVPTPQKALTILGVGSCIPRTGRNYRFMSTQLSTMCTNLPSDFERQLVPSGPIGANDVFDALYVTGAYEPIATYSYDQLNGLDNTGWDETATEFPFYPRNDGSDVVVDNAKSKVLRGSSPVNYAGDMFFVGEAGDSGNMDDDKPTLMYTLSGTMSQYRACKDYKGNDVFTVAHDADTGTITYNLPLFVQRLVAAGTNLADRQWEQLQCEQKVFTVTVDNDVTGSTWVNARDLDMETSIVSMQFVSCTQPQCVYDNSQLANTGTEGDAGNQYDCNCDGECPSDAAFRAMRTQVMLDIERTAGDTGGDIGVRPVEVVPFVVDSDLNDDTAVNAIGESCYGLPVGSDTTSAVFVPKHKRSSTYNRWLLTIESGCQSMYDNVGSANDKQRFSKCSVEGSRDNYDFNVDLKQVKAAATSWSSGIASRLEVDGYDDYSRMEIRVRALTTGPLVITNLENGDESGGFTETQLNVFLSPETQGDGVWRAENRSALTASSGGIVFDINDRIIITQHLVHAATKDTLELHIRDVLLCELNTASPYHDCLHSAADGAAVAQKTCPANDNGNENLLTGCDESAWKTWIAANDFGAAMPMKRVIPFVREYVPVEAGVGELGNYVKLCRQSVKMAPQANRPGDSSFFCQNHGDADYKCGSGSSSFNAEEKDGFSSTSTLATGLYSQWELLTLNEIQTPQRGLDAVEIGLNGVPPALDGTGDRFITVRATVYDCQDGSENDGDPGAGVRLLGERGAKTVYGNLALRGGRALAETTTVEMSNGASKNLAFGNSFAFRFHNTTSGATVSMTVDVDPVTKDHTFIGVAVGGGICFCGLIVFAGLAYRQHRRYKDHERV